MKSKNFDEYLRKRLNKSEIEEIEKQAKFEKLALENLQKDVSFIVNEYMRKEAIGFNELARRLDASPNQINKILKGTANLTLATIAHISALMNKQPHLVMK